MKKIMCILYTGILLCSCTNRDIEFDDYDYTTVYFPLSEAYTDPDPRRRIGWK
jgi:hypothetical protein